MTKWLQLYKQVWKLIASKKQFTIVTHIEPDGDTLGSAVALKEIILANVDQSRVKIVSQKLPRNLSFLLKSTEVGNDYFDNSQVIVVDTSTISRLADERVNTNDAIKIDHHPHENNWLASIGGDHWPATGQILYEMAKLLNLKLTPKAKDAIFVAIWTDTNKLTHRNISEITYEAVKNCEQNKDLILKKIKLNKREMAHINSLAKKIQVQKNLTYLITDDIVPNDYLREMTSIFFTKCTTNIYFSAAKNQKNQFRCELRSKSNFNVSQLAKYFGGGGHFSSAGFRRNSLAEVKTCLSYILNKVNQ